MLIPPAIEAISLVKRYGRRSALAGIDLVVEPGRVLGLIGPNGAGKTTTMRILLDFLRPTSGAVRVLGTQPSIGGAALRRRIGYLPGELALDSPVSAGSLLHHLAEVGGHRGTPIAAFAERLELDLSRPVRSLSRGNKQKVGLVQAFAHSPELLVLDEPTSGLDPLVQQEFATMVREARDDGRTVLLSSHVISQIQQMADEIAVLRDGRVAEVSTVDRLRASALREVRVTVRREARVDLIERLDRIAELRERVERLDGEVLVVHARLGGGIGAFVACLAGLELVDLVVQEPDLEQAVLGYYAPPTEEHGTTA